MASDEDIGYIKGTLDAMREDIAEVKEDMKEIRKDQTNQKVKLAAASSTFGAVSGALVAWWRSHT
jgi:hypothetical protein